MKRSKHESHGGRPRRPARRRTIGLETLERRELLAASLDPTFGVGGLAQFQFESVGGMNAQYGDVTQLPDGSFIIVGTATGPLGNRDYAVVKLDPDGNLDTTFNNGTGARLVAFDLGGGLAGDNDDVASGVTIQPDTNNDGDNDDYKIIVAGRVGGANIGLTRLNPDGSLDTTFQEGRVTTLIRFGQFSGFGADFPAIKNVSIEYHPFTTDLIVAAGNALYNFSSDNGRFNFSRRVTFTGNTGDTATPRGPGVNADTIINDLLIDPSGRILVAGLGKVTPETGDTFDPAGINRFARNAMGIARFTSFFGNDPTFGQFRDTYNGQGFSLTQLDDGFIVSGLFFEAEGIALGPNGQIFMAGTQSATEGGEGRLIITRLTSDGDLSFGYGGAGVLPVETFTRGFDVAYDAVTNKVIAVGYANLGSPTRQEFAIVQTDMNGVVDVNFATVFGAAPNQDVFQTVSFNQLPNNDRASDLILLPDGRVVVIGTTRDAAITEIGLARLLTEEPPTVSIDDVTVTEGDSGTVDAVFTVSLSGASRVPITVNLRTTSGSAVAGTDFTDLPVTTLTFLPGQPISQTVTVRVLADFLDEFNETFTVNLISSDLGTIVDPQGVGTILDNDPQHPTIFISDAVVTEGHSGTVNAVFRVFLSRPFQLPISFDVSTADGTALFGTDYGAILGPTRLTFEPGVTELFVSVPVIGDRIFEPDETFFLNVSNSDLGLFGEDTQGRGTIVADEGPPPTFLVSDAVMTEGDPGTVNTVVFRVFLSFEYIHEVSVDVATANGTALFGTDYGAIIGPTRLTFAPGVTELFVSVPVIGDSIDETDETFFLNLSNADLGVFGGDTQGRGTIVDDEGPPPSISIFDVTVPEGNSGTSLATFTIRLEYGYKFPISVNVATANGAAIFATDFGSITPTRVDFAPGVTERTVSVPVFSDSLVEPDKSFFVNLFNAVVANTLVGTIRDGQAVGVITNDDTPPDLTPPVVTSVTALRGAGGRRGRQQRVAGFELQFSEALNASTAQNLDNYVLQEVRRGPGRRGRPRRVGLGQVQYDPSRNVVTLVAAGQPQFQRGAVITVGTGITDMVGNPFDGNSDGTPGPNGLFVV